MHFPFQSFRARLMFVFVFLLAATLGVQFYLNRRAEREREKILAEQEKALGAGVALGFRTFATNDYLTDLRERANEPLLDEKAGRITNILVIDEKGCIYDSLDVKYRPNYHDNTYDCIPVTTLPLPRFVNIVKADNEVPAWLKQVKVEAAARGDEPRAIPFPIQVSPKDSPKVFWYVIVVLGATQPASAWQTAKPLIYTLTFMLLALAAAAFLVWRFTSPIAALSTAAQRVAQGDFDVRVAAAQQADEMGRLAASFNAMTAQLEHTRGLETKLRQAEQSAVIGRLASAVAHEIRNPLNYINLSLDQLRAKYFPADAAQRESFTRLTSGLKTEIQRINKHVTDLSDFARPSQLQLEPLDVRAEIADALRLVEAQAAEQSIRLEVNQPDAPVLVTADRTRLHSVLTNLILNGIQAIKDESGTLAVMLETNALKRQARITIRDTGHGIAAEDLPKIFEPYYSTKETGTGLGLAIVKKAVTEHGGTIDVTSIKDEGTTFVIELPLASEH